MNSSVYRRNIKAAKYFFDLDISQIVDNLAYAVWNWVQKLWLFLIDTFRFLDLTKYIDEKEVSKDVDKKDNRYLNDMVIRSRRAIRSIPSILSYFSYVPLLLEVWSMFFNPSSIVRLWILGSFGITFLCIWSIVTDRLTVSSFVCGVIGVDRESFHLDDILRVTGLVSICIGFLLFGIFVWNLEIMSCIVSITVSNRIYRNIRSYLTIIDLEY